MRLVLPFEDCSLDRMPHPPPEKIPPIPGWDGDGAGKAFDGSW